ncbi:MAG TPA: septum formation protein Maf, partial [Firmicutes bacterium]|nr:septum formation protein Maf [Bacillota bacterium]
GSEPGALVEELARRKAAAVAASLEEPDERLVVGADTIVVLADRILGKPRDEAEARSMLTALSGRWHQVFTGVAVIDPVSGRTVSAHETTRVKFRCLAARGIAAYVATGEPLDKAGAYGVQGKGALLVECIDGCFYNVVGLPLVKLAAVLREFGFDVWEEGKGAGHGVSFDA